MISPAKPKQTARTQDNGSEVRERIAIAYFPSASKCLAFPGAMGKPSNDEPNLQQAIAYLKTSVPAAHGEIEVSELDFPVLTDLGNGLLVGYLVDRASYFQYVQQRHLQDAQWTKAALHESGLKNLAGMLQRTGARVVPYPPPDGTVHAVFLDGHFEASLILVDELWDQHLARLAPNGFIAAIPNRDILAFCDAKSAAGVDELRRIVTRVEGGDHPLATTLYRRAPGFRSWRPYAI